MAELFATSKPAFGYHIINILKESKLCKYSVDKEFLTTATAMQNDKRATWGDSLFINWVVTYTACPLRKLTWIVKTQKAKKNVQFFISSSLNPLSFK